MRAAAARARRPLPSSSILAGLPAEIFAADDALGWVYQFWQKDKKDEVNASERKIGGADLGPVTQLFTENYMVRFLLENSLGAWWAARHPDSPLVKDFDYLRFDDDGEPAAGSFEGWPDRVAEVTVMDPCCGSGHFLVEAFSMLWQMRAEEEGLAPVDAQDAVLRDNLFGLELDPRCVQIAMFAVALQAWKAGGGWRELPVPNIACSGIPVKAPSTSGRHSPVATSALRTRSCGCTSCSATPTPSAASSTRDARPRSAIPDGCRRRSRTSTGTRSCPLAEQAADGEGSRPSGGSARSRCAGIARLQTTCLARYTLVATNVPYLGAKQSDVFEAILRAILSRGWPDLATAFVAAISRTVEQADVAALLLRRIGSSSGAMSSLDENAY